MISDRPDQCQPMTCQAKPGVQTCDRHVLHVAVPITAKAAKDFVGGPLWIIRNVGPLPGLIWDWGELRSQQQHPVSACQVHLEGTSASARLRGSASHASESPLCKKKNRPAREKNPWVKLCKSGEEVKKSLRPQRPARGVQEVDGVCSAHQEVVEPVLLDWC